MPNKMTRFTQRARRVLSFAQESAEKLQHPAIDSDHILIGLMQEQGGVAARVLTDLDLPISRLSEVEDLCRENHKDEKRTEGNLDLSDETKRILELAVDEASRMGHHYLGTEHLLLGLLRLETGHAAAILDHFQITQEAIRKNVRQVLQSVPPPDDDSERSEPSRQVRGASQQQFVVLRSLLQANLLHWMGRSSSPERRSQARSYIQSMFDRMAQTPGLENYPEADRMQLFSELMAAFEEKSAEPTFTLRVLPHAEGAPPTEVSFSASALWEAVNQMMQRDVSEGDTTIFVMDTPNQRIEITRRRADDGDSPPDDDSHNTESPGT